MTVSPTTLASGFLSFSHELLSRSKTSVMSEIGLANDKKHPSENIAICVTHCLPCVSMVAHSHAFRRDCRYNTPRAGVNLNDNFAGGNVLESNVIYNTVRETNDHGPINSWSRMGFLNTETTAEPSCVSLHVSLLLLHSDPLTTLHTSL